MNRPVTFSLISDGIDHHADVRPDHPAVRCGDRALSYRELQKATNQLANTLVAADVAVGDRVGLYLHKSIETVVSAYGIMKAGAAFVPIDPQIPTDRLRAIMNDCDVSVVVTEDRKVDQLIELASLTPLRVLVGPDASEREDAEVSDLSVISWTDVATQRENAPDLEIKPDDLAYLMYTSGSTGVPKGMMHSHRTSLGFSSWGVDYCNLIPHDRVASHGPLHFDISIFDIFSTGLAGATAVLVPEPVTKFPASLSQFLADEGVSVIFTVPFALAQLVDNGALEDRDLSALRWVLFGGESFTPRQLRRLMLAIPDAAFANVYGPAEAPACVCHVVEHPPDTDAPIPIGTISAGTVAVVTRPGNDEEVDVGEVGELVIDAQSVTLGYWNRPDLNARSLRADGSFRTGDLVRIDPDGTYQFLGRSDRMVKTRGFRVELDEIEAALASHPEVTEAATFALTDDDGTTTVHCAYVSVAEIAPASLRRHLATRLPNYALPVTIRREATFPRTTSDKVDRPALARATAIS